MTGQWMGGDGGLKADPDAISSYARDLAIWGMTVQTKPSTALAQMMPLAQHAFGVGGVAGRFQEAALVRAAVVRHTSQFTEFLGDVSRGIAALANAAQVCADTYRGTDSDAAENIDIVRFAFADSDVSRPAGLDPKVTGKSLSDIEMELAAQAGPVPDALANPDGGYTYYPTAGLAVTMYPDGSTKQVLTTISGTGSTTVTEVFDVNGRALSKTSESSASSAAGASRIISEGLDPKTAITTTTTTAPDGTITIVSEQNGKQIGYTVVHPAEPPAAVDPRGPLETALDQLGPQAAANAGVHGYGDVKDPH